MNVEALAHWGEGWGAVAPNKKISVDGRRDCCHAKAEISYSASTVDSLTRKLVDDIEMKAVLEKKGHR